jgi:chaperone modulatory protein CbpM
MNEGMELQAHLLDERDWIGATEICQLCRIELTAIVELVDLGVVSPRGDAPEQPAEQPEQWQFPASELSRLRTAARLMRDLGLNVSGAALAVELLEQQHNLERRLRRLERLAHE